MNNRSIFVLLLVAFLDAFGVGLVYPLFSAMLFDPTWHFLDPSASDTIRGFYLGLLLSTMPLIQMIVSPYFGSLSDRVGRRPIILATLSCASVGYFVATMSVLYQSLTGLIISRAILGLSAANYAAAYACITDVYPSEEKGQYFARLSMAFGAGFAIGPLVGSVVASNTALWRESFARPFIVSGVLAFCSLLAVIRYLPETCTSSKECETKHGSSLKDIFDIDASVLWILGAIFLLAFGWTFYSELVPVLWVTQFKLAPNEVGLFFTYGAVWYVLFCRFVSTAIMKRWSHLLVFEMASISLACFIWMLFIFKTQEAYWVAIPLQNLSLACFFPVSATVLSGMAPKDQQGKIMGLQLSAESLGVGIGPLFSGCLLGINILFPIVLGGLAALCAGVILRYVRRVYLPEHRLDTALDL